MTKSRSIQAQKVRSKLQEHRLGNARSKNHVNFKLHKRPQSPQSNVHHHQSSLRVTVHFSQTISRCFKLPASGCFLSTRTRNSIQRRM